MSDPMRQSQSRYENHHILLSFRFLEIASYRPATRTRIARLPAHPRRSFLPGGNPAPARAVGESVTAPQAGRAGRARARWRRESAVTLRAPWMCGEGCGERRIPWVHPDFPAVPSRRELPSWDMLFRWVGFLVLLLLVPAPAHAGAAGEVTHQGTRYRTYGCAPSEIELFWLDDAGRPIHRFSRLQEIVRAKGRRLRFAMNAGIFEEGGIPSGLLIVEGKELLPLNRATGKGNFFLQPNGVFFWDAEQAGVVSTVRYAGKQRSPRFAVQSGPLLLEDGNTHPAFRKDSPNRLHRNGVGILPDGKVLFAITVFRQDKHPNLFEFADFFRAQGCRNALFLDGDISLMEVDPRADLVPGNAFAAIFAVIDGGP